MTDGRTTLQKTLLNPRFVAMLPITLPLIVLFLGMGLAIDLAIGLGRRAEKASEWFIHNPDWWLPRLLAFARKEAPAAGTVSHDNNPFKDL